MSDFVPETSGSTAATTTRPGEAAGRGEPLKVSFVAGRAKVEHE